MKKILSLILSFFKGTSLILRSSLLPSPFTERIGDLFEALKNGNENFAYFEANDLTIQL